MTNFTSPLMYKIPCIPEDSVFFRPVNVIFQWIAFIVLCIVIFGSEFILMIIVGYLDGELNSIVVVITQLSNGYLVKRRGRSILLEVHKMHVKVLNILQDLITIYWHLSLHILLSNFLFICLNLYAARFISLSISTIFTLINCFFQLCIMCFISQIIRNKTENVADALWETSWYDFPVEDQRFFALILSMAQMPKGIRACGLSTISVNTLVQVLMIL